MSSHDTVNMWPKEKWRRNLLLIDYVAIFYKKNNWQQQFERAALLDYSEGCWSTRKFNFISHVLLLCSCLPKERSTFFIVSSLNSGKDQTLEIK